MTRHQIYAMSFASVYRLYIAKVEKKARTKDEVDTAICWLTGYDQPTLDQMIADESDVETFFASAPDPNPLRSKITGVICGVRISEIEELLMREIRYLDKLVDEIARGRPLEKVLRR